MADTYSRDARADKTSHCAANCRWASPTLFLAAPWWFDAEGAPWTCMRDPLPHVLDTTEECASCVRWDPRERTADVTGAGPVVPDWFGAFPPPHEVR